MNIYISRNSSSILSSMLSFTILVMILFFATAINQIYAQSEYLNPDGKGEITFTPGLRIQPKYEFNSTDNNNDFYISRVRLKGKGNIYDMASYYFEVKLDNVGRFNRSTTAQIENAWFDFPVEHTFHIRTGFFDIPFSRNALTSDSKLLLIDRSMIKDALTSIGFADNTIGVFAHGRPLDGHFSYAVGIFDNLNFEVENPNPILTRKANGFMTSGRIAYDFLDPAPDGGYADYQGSYIGKGHRLSVGTNAAFLPKASINTTEFDIFAWGTDIFFNTGPFTAEAEYDLFNLNMKTLNVADINGTGWYIQGGYLLTSLIEIASRYQEVDPNKDVSGDKLRAISIGANFYLHAHNLKIQTDYTFKKEEILEIDNDVFQIQLQLDF